MQTKRNYVRGLGITSTKSKRKGIQDTVPEREPGQKSTPGSREDSADVGEEVPSPELGERQNSRGSADRDHLGYTPVCRGIKPLLRVGNGSAVKVGLSQNLSCGYC